MNKTILLFFFVLISLSGFTQTDTSSGIEMDILGIEDFDEQEFDQKKLVTAASRSNRNSEELPFTVYIITKEEIKQKHYITLVDILKDIPGVKVSQPGNAINGETFLLRGQFGNYYTKILIDNVPIQPSAVGGMPIGAQLPLKHIDRIEVIAGPAADLYGADAMAGVINIVTRSSEKLKWGYADFEFGYPFYMNFNFSIGGKTSIGKRIFEYSLYGGAMERENKNIVQGYEDTYNPQNYSITGDTSFLNSPYYKGTSTAPEINNLLDQALHGGLRLKGKYLMFGVDYMSRKEHAAIGLNPLYKAYHDPNDITGENITRVFGKYTRTFGKFKSETNLSYLYYSLNQNSSYKTISNPQNVEGDFYSYAASNDIFIEQLFNYVANNNFNILFGATFQYATSFPTYNYFPQPFNTELYKPFSSSLPSELDSLTETGFTPYNYTNTSGLLQAYYDKNKWHLVLGARLDYHSQFGFSVNPKAGILFKINNKVNLRTSFGTAFRPPSAYHIFGGYYSTNNTSNPIPNYNLNAEKNLSAEIGARWKISKSNAIDFHVYHVRTRNFITKTSTFSSDFSRSYYGYINDDKSKNHLTGVVLEHSISELFGKSQSFSRASVQLSSGGETLPFDRGEIDRYKELPQLILKWNFGFSFLEHFTARLTNTYMSNWISSSIVLSELQEELTNDGFYLLDVQLDYKLNPNAALYFIVQNATNTTYGGIGASGGLGVFNNQVIVEDLTLNPQKRINWRFGARINF